MSAPGQDAAQPTGTAPTDGQGQGQDRSFSSILGQDAFSNAPEELRPHLEEYVRTQVDPRLTQRFQESAQFRQTWEPFSQVEGLTDMQPEELNELLGFYELTLAAQQGNEEAKEALAEWIDSVGGTLGLWEGGDDEEDDDGGSDDPRDQELAELRERLEAMEQGHQQATAQQTEQQIQTEIRGFVEGLQLPGDPGSDERKDAEDAVYTFMLRYEDPQMSNEDVVKAAFEDYQRLTGAGQRQLLEENENAARGTNLRGGGADTAPEEVKSWADADRLAKARLSGATQ